MEKENPSKVYFCSRINAENLVKAYQALGREAKGRGYKTLDRRSRQPQPSKHRCNKTTGTAYKGYYRGMQYRLRGTTQHCSRTYADSRRTWFHCHSRRRYHGCRGRYRASCKKRTPSKSQLCRKNWENYDFTIVLSHFKGHPMAGFGGALKMWPSAWHRRVEKRGYILPALHWMCLSTGRTYPAKRFPRIHG